MARKKKAALVELAEAVKASAAETQGMPASAETTAVEVQSPVRVELATEREAKAVTQSLRDDFRKFTAAWWEMGQRVKDALDRQVPAAMGLNAYDWMLSVFGETASVAKIQRSLRIARALDGIPVEKVKLLTEGKAYLLTQLKPQDRADYADLAVAISNEQFKEMVQQRRIEYGVPAPEAFCEPFPRMPESFQPIFDDVEKRLAATIGLDVAAHPELRFQVIEALFGALMICGDAVYAELLADYRNMPPGAEEDAA